MHYLANKCLTIQLRCKAQQLCSVNIQISQHSAATNMRKDDNFNQMLLCSSPLDAIIKELPQFVNIYKSCHKN